MRSWPRVEQPPIPARFVLPELSLFDTASQRLEKIEIKSEHEMYVCGITPYDATHLGHAATYLTFDLVNRYWLAQGSKVNYIQNVTDIDDPLLERANRDGIDWQKLATSQIDLFRSDMSALHILPPTIYVGAIEEIPAAINAINDLYEKGVAYKVEKDFYFDTERELSFGSRSHLETSEQLRIFGERGGDPEKVGKRNQLDPLLWRSHREGEPEWGSNLGPGRPGWHIECTAIALKYAKQSPDYILDIQGGGKDLIFPHHEMCATQAKIIDGKELAKVYLHTGLIGLDGEKMSKSKGNLIFVSKLLANGIDAMAIRWALIKRSYAQDSMWTENLLQNSIRELEIIRTGLSRQEVPETDQVIQNIISSIANNLDTRSACESLIKWSKTEGTGGNSGELSRVIDSLLGISL